MRITSVIAMLATTALASGRQDHHNDFVQVAAENGFASESYTVVTEDGYVSQIYRIPGKFGESGNGKPAVLLMHGIECDMNFWTVNSADVAPPFVLSQ